MTQFIGSTLEAGRIEFPDSKIVEKVQFRCMVDSLNTKDDNMVTSHLTKMEKLTSSHDMCELIAPGRARAESVVARESMCSASVKRNNLFKSD